MTDTTDAGAPWHETIAARRIFEEYAGGHGLHRIASGLNRDGILSPAAHDPARNRHRADAHGRWAKSAVRAILGNPRYTGFEVWNKQRKDEVLVDVEDVALGHVTKQRWNDKDDWIWSAEPTHEALVSRDLFDAVQGMFGTKRGPTTRTPIKGRRYVLSGLLHCDLCGRRMQGQWTHGQAYYRCKFVDEYPGGDEQHPKNVYVREAAITPGLDAWLGSLFDDEHLDDTCAALAGASAPDPEAEKRDADLRTKIADCDRRIRNYRALLDNEDTVTLAAGWIAEVQRERKGLEQQLGRHVPGGELTADEVKALVTALKDIVSVLAQAEPADKAELYDQLGVRLRYDPSGSVSVQSEPRGVTVGVGGPTRPLGTRQIRRSGALAL